MVTMYRWKCECGKHGRWLRNPNAAAAYGSAHEDRAHARGENLTRRAYLWRQIEPRAATPWASTTEVCEGPVS